MAAAEDLGVEKVQGDIRLFGKSGSYIQLHLEGVRAAGMGKKELAEYIVGMIVEQLPGAPSELGNLRKQVETLENSVKERDQKIVALENQLKAKK